MNSLSLERSPSDAGETSRGVARASASSPFAEHACIRSCESADDLEAIASPEVELVVWRRELPGCLRDWLAELDAALLPDIRVLVRPQDLIPALDSLLSESGIPKGAMLGLLMCDVKLLVSAFARITRSDLVDVRLECVSDDACWKFHRDCVEARLLTTYRGPTTEWVQPEQASAALEAQTGFTGPIERLGANDVALFKGSCAGPGTGIVHRSPPIMGTGQTRLLLCLNKPSAVSPELWSDEQG